MKERPINRERAVVAHHESEDNGTTPVEEFLLALPATHRAKAMARIRLLEEEGPDLPFPYSSQVTGRLRELRTQHGKEKLRILYFGDPKKVFILLHGVIKRSDRLHKVDIEVAKRRMERHLERTRGGN